MASVVGLVAAGHPLTAEAAAQTLRDGGNAFDAAIAAGFAAAVAEPCLTSLGGGGFLLAHTAGGDDVLFDFFVAAPGLGRARAGDDPVLVPVPIHFDAAVQLFHVGPASVATPGVLAGYLHVHRRLGRLDLVTVVAPAIALARHGIAVDPFLERLIRLLRPLLTLTRPGDELFAPEGRPLGRGDVFRNHDLADYLDAVSDGTVDGLAADDLGGAVTADDLAAYHVVERVPLAVAYRDALVLTNPPPSFGGTLVAHGLQHLERASSPGPRHEPARVLALVDALCAITDHRLTLGPGTSTGTTHVSVADAEGNVASMTTSNGSGSGVFAAGTGVQMNNMMGEEDLHPSGFGALEPGTRIGSMMAPTLVLRPRREPVALGSGGSERIRSTLTQLVATLVDEGGSLADVIDAPRLHWDGTAVQAEAGVPPEALAALRARWAVNEWPGLDLYFGGANAVARPGEAHGDPRRGGAALVVSA